MLRKSSRWSTSLLMKHGRKHRSRIHQLKLHIANQRVRCLPAAWKARHLVLFRKMLLSPVARTRRRLDGQRGNCTTTPITHNAKHKNRTSLERCQEPKMT